MKRFFFFILELIFSRGAILCGPVFFTWLAFLAFPGIRMDSGIVEELISTILFSIPASLGLFYSVMLLGLADSHSERKHP